MHLLISLPVSMVFWLPAAKPVVAIVLLIALWSLEAVLPAFTGRKRRAGHAAHNLSLDRDLTVNRFSSMDEVTSWLTIHANPA